MKTIANLSFVTMALLGGCVVDTSSDAYIYDRCNNNSSCGGDADQCFSVTVNGASERMCSTYCASDSQCAFSTRSGIEGACYSLYGDPTDTHICYERCNTNGDCDFGFRCTDADVNGDLVTDDRICLPY